MDKFRQDKHGVFSDLTGRGKRNKASSSVCAFLVLTLTFIIGSVTGTLLGMTSDTASVGVASSLDGTIDTAFGIGILPLLIYPALAVILGLSVPGTLLLPLLTALRGFTFSFSVAALLPALSAEAELELIRSIALPTLVSVAILMVLSTQALLASMRLLKLTLYNTRSGSGKLFPGHYRITLIICAVTLTIVALIVR
jgi:hypothetical protein